MDIKRVGSQPSGKGPSEWFTGMVRIDPLFTGTGPHTTAIAHLAIQESSTVRLSTGWNMSVKSNTESDRARED